jgi:hypothetical protein
MLEAEVMADGNEIDLVKYGVLWQKVQDMDKKVDKMERNVEELLALANKGRGGFWAGMVFVSLVSSAIGFSLSWIKGH